jgi:hypothetical protein
VSNGVNLTPPTVNRIPGGLLGFFGIQSGGRNPESISPGLLAQIDLTQWYFGTNRVYLRSSVNIAATFFTPVYQVPLGEHWYCENICYVSPTLGAGQTLETMPCLQDASGTRQNTLIQMPGSRTVGAVYAVTAGGFFMAPGEQLGLYTTQLVAGPVNAGVYTLAYARLA